MEILLNCYYNNKHLILFKENNQIYFGKMHNNCFEKILDNEKQNLKDILNKLINTDIKEDKKFIKNITIIDIDFDYKIDYDKLIKINVSNEQTFINNCNILNSTKNNLHKKFKIAMSTYNITSILYPYAFFWFLVFIMTIFNNAGSSGLDALGKLAIIFLITPFISLIYQIIYVIIISKKYLLNVNKLKIFIYTLFMFISVTIIFSNIFMLINLMFLVVSNIVLITLENKQKKAKESTKIKKSKMLSIITLILVILSIIKISLSITYNINKYNEYKEEWNIKQQNSPCMEYITSTDRYIYCETDTRNIKQINLQTKEVKLYNPNIYSFITSKNYIYYYVAEWKNDTSYKTLYYIDINNGTQEKIDTYKDVYDIYWYTSNDEQLYYTLEKFPQIEYEPVLYSFNPSKNNLTQINEPIYNIQLVKDNLIYYIDKDKNKTAKLNTYNIDSKQKANLFSDSDLTAFEKSHVKNLGKNDKLKISFIVRDGELYILDLENNNLFMENSKYYQDVIENDNILFLLYENEKSDLHNISYIDLEDSQLEIIDTNIEIEIEVREVNQDYNIVAKNNDIYYTEIFNNKNILYKNNILTNEKTLICDKDIESFYIDKDKNFIYIIEKNGTLSRININNETYEIIINNWEN